MVSISAPSQARMVATAVLLPLPSTPIIATTQPPPGARRLHGRGQWRRRLFRPPASQNIIRPMHLRRNSTAL